MDHLAIVKLFFISQMQLESPVMAYDNSKNEVLEKIISIHSNEKSKHVFSMSLFTDA